MVLISTRRIFASVLLLSWGGGVCLADEPAAVIPNRIVILGSSTAAGEAARPLDSSWANKYAAHVKSLYPSSAVYNLAVGGFTTFNVMPTGFVPPDPWNTPQYQPVPSRNITRALELEPDIIIINLPTNDCNAYIPVAQQIDNYNTFISQATSHNIQVYVTTSQPRSNDPTTRALLMQLRDTTLLLYGSRAIDFWSGLADDNGNILARYNYDNTHLNNAGHAVLFERVRNSVLIPLDPVDESPHIVVRLKIFLQGALSDGSMRTALQQSGALPFEQPYAPAPWGYAGTESVSAMPDGVVDWLLIELRSAPSPSTLAGQRAALLHSDGTVTDIDGGTALDFQAVAAGSYFIVVRHRNHLAAMSATALELNKLSPLYDFTTDAGKFYGGGAIGVDGLMAMIGGDADASGTVGALDRAATWNSRNNAGYLIEDLDLSGEVGALDRALVWNNRNMSTMVPDTEP
jgi:lysophospholipase L1-like esterase